MALRLDGPDPGRLMVAADAAAALLREALRPALEDGSCHVLGPVPAPLEKLRNRWRAQILVKARPLAAATGPLGALAPRLYEGARRDGVRLLVDVGPMSLM